MTALADRLFRYSPLLVLALLWEMVSYFGLVSRSLLPSVGDVLTAGSALFSDGEIWVHTWYSLYRGAAGLALAIVVGGSIGICMAWWKPVNAVLGPIVEIFYPLPKSALIPVTALWLGFGDASKILLIFLGSMLPVAIGAYNGARGAEQTLIWSARCMGASRLRTLWDVVVPSALPELLNGIRTALALTFILLVASELIVARQGLGYLIGYLGDGGNYAGMFAVTMIVAGLGFAADRGYMALSRRDPVMARLTEAVLPRVTQRDADATHAARTLDKLWWGIVSWLPVIVLIAAWEAFSRSGLVTPFALPAFSAVIERIVTDGQSGDLFTNIGLTLWRTFFGFAIAASLGIVLGLAIARFTLARWFFDPIISVGFPMPKIAFLPIIVLWLGFFDVSKITMVAFNTIFPVVTATVVGIMGVEKELIWSARNLGTTDRRLMWDVLLPAALPQILTGLQVALPIALIVCIITEMSMGGYGVGGAMQSASRFADSRGVFAGIVETTVVGYIMIKGMAILRRRLLVWHQEALDPTTA